MDLGIASPILDSINQIMPMLGFSEIVQKNLELKNSKITVSGVILRIGIIGDKKGDIIYSIDVNDAKKIASTMMMGMPVEEMDDMAESAISELSNMLAANAGINYSRKGINLDISCPTLIYGNLIDIKMSKSEVIYSNFDIDGMNMNIHIALD